MRKHGRLNERAESHLRDIELDPRCNLDTSIIRYSPELRTQSARAIVDHIYYYCIDYRRDRYPYNLLDMDTLVKFIHSELVYSINRVSRISALELRSAFPMSLIVDQPEPTQNTGDIWELVMDDMLERRKLGIQRYGTPLQAHNGRDALVDAYQEALDLCVYLRQAIEERRIDGSQ